MKRAIVGMVVATAAWIGLPGGVAAQCEGGTSTAGQYVGSNYQPGGCSFTNSTTPGQLHPSGAQPLPSTSPAQGLSALPGQLAPTGLLPVRSGDLGQPLGATGPLPQTLGPGTGRVIPVFTLPGTEVAVGVPSVNTSVGRAAGTMVGPISPVNDITLTRGLPNTVGAPAPAMTVISDPGNSTSANPLATAQGAQPLSVAPVVPINTAYSFSLPVAPAVSADTVSPTAPADPAPPPAPGRGGPTYIGEERGDDPTVSND